MEIFRFGKKSQKRSLTKPENQAERSSADIALFPQYADSVFLVDECVPVKKTPPFC